jgi:hypothetical protein
LQTTIKLAWNLTGSPTKKEKEKKIVTLIQKSIKFEEYERILFGFSK